MYSTTTLEIYLDILFILNFVMDYFIFWIVSKIILKKTSKIKLFFGAFIAALLYCLTVVVPFFRTMSIWIWLLLLPILPIVIIFTPSTIKEFIRIFIISNVIAFGVGGVVFVIFYSIQEGGTLSYFYKESSKKLTVWILIISMGVFYIMIHLFHYYIKKRNIGIQKLYSLQIICNDEQVHMEGLLDTGNKVYEPITGCPVVIVEYGMIINLLPEKIRILYNDMEEDIALLVQGASDTDFAGRIRIIPYHSLGNPNGMLLGFKPDKILIQYHKEEWKTISEVIIGIYRHNLDSQGRYKALIHADFACEI